MKKSINILQPPFAPWVGFFQQLKLVSTHCFMINVKYSPKTLLKRTKFYNKNILDFFWFNIIAVKHHRNEFIKNILILDLLKTKKNLLDYFLINKKIFPYFKDIEQIIEKIFTSTKLQKVYELNISTIIEISKYLELDKKFIILDNEKENDKDKDKNTYLISVIKKFGCNYYVTGHGANNYLDLKKFNEEGIDVHLMEYKINNYFNTNEKFVPYLSILDLIGRKGKDSIKYI